MNNLVLATSAIGFALGIPHAQAGSLMMDEPPLLLSVRGGTSIPEKTTKPTETEAEGGH